MIIETEYQVGNLISIRGSTEVWKIMAIHTSSYNNKISILYDVKNTNGKLAVTQEQRIERRII